ncbi:MAG TPA: acyl-CoA dehydrogenase C-terminal domain-containing protein [Allosphingosinicella sp.]|nr:acyl-CoA dehydrogenase C-terminal domain-containing protein [Allosphingosinicella sp.]
MPNYQPAVQDLKFVINDVLNAGASLSSFPIFENVDDDLIGAIIDQLGTMAAEVIAPTNEVGDREGATLGPNGVTVPAAFHTAYTSYVEAAWPSLTCAPEYGGQGLPDILLNLPAEMLGGANSSFAMIALTGPGVFRVIESQASEELKKRYLPKVASGEWAGAMSLTESQCGTALGLIRTRAEPQADGTYKVTGTKIFNTFGDHDLTENIVHLVLARLPDAPEGIKGISLFLVPKYVVGPDGELGARNSFSCGGLEKKLGIHGSPTCVTNFEGATGYLLGTPNRGMEGMFIIMNKMRLAAGASAVGISDAAYQNALNYAKERLAGRSPTGAKYPDLPGDPIIVHPDVRRMLMLIRSYVEGGRLLCYWVGLNLDLAHVHTDEVQRERSELLVSLLTPVIKAFLSDKGSECCDVALQCFGGHGYIRDNGAEQYLRDVRVQRLGEGTSGVQALDFIGRKVVRDGGQALNLYFGRIREWLDADQAASEPGVDDALRRALDSIERLTAEHLPIWKDDPEAMAAVSLDFLHMIGYLTLAHMWAWMARVARESLQQSSPESIFFENKIRTARFYCSYILPEIEALALRVRAGGRDIMSIPERELA